VGEVVKVKRIFKLIKSELFMALIALLILSLLSLLFLVVCGESVNKFSYFKMIKILMFWFGYPILVQPVLFFIYPEYDSDSSFYSSVGIYYLGLFLSYLLKSIIVGFLTSFGLGCYIIYRVYIKSKAA